MQILKVKKDKRIEEGLLKIGEVANLAGLLPSCVRYYTQLGFLKVQMLTQGGYWLYDKDQTLKVLSEIEELRKKSLSLEQIMILKKKQGKLERRPEINQAKVRNRSNRAS